MPTINDGSKHFQAVTYTGNGSTNTITGLSFQPDFVWIKSRSSADWHGLYDAVRTSGKVLYSNSTSAEVTNDVNGYLSSFNSNGFTVTAGSSTAAGVNANGTNYVAWCWKGANSTSNIAVNAYGSTPSIPSTVSANTSAGFSVVTYTGTGANATVGHGLGVAPQFIIGKRRGGVGNWQVYHSSISGMSTGYITLNDTGGFRTTPSTIWNSTPPNATTFSLGTDSDLNSGSTNVAYCFAPVAGYSAFGSFSGNGSTDGPFIYTGFRPRWIVIKMYSGAVGQSWVIHDTSRGLYNVDILHLQAESSNAENSNASNSIDVLSNGFKLRSTDNAYNASSYSYVWAAFSENPFKYSRAR